MERDETMLLMDQVEALVLKKGWPIPFTPYYLVHHERLLALLDKLRASLQDELDSRFLQAFGPTDPLTEDYEPRVRKAHNGKER